MPSFAEGQDFGAMEASWERRGAEIARLLAATRKALGAWSEISKRSFGDDVGAQALDRLRLPKVSRPRCPEVASMSTF